MEALLLSLRVPAIYFLLLRINLNVTLGVRHIVWTPCPHVVAAHEHAGSARIDDNVRGGGRCRIEGETHVTDA